VRHQEESEHGQKPDQLPGYRKIDDPSARRLVREAAERSVDLVRTKRAVNEARSVSSSRDQ
jgi:hypothetical protein